MTVLDHLETAARDRWLRAWRERLAARAKSVTRPGAVGCALGMSSGSPTRLADDEPPQTRRPSIGSVEKPEEQCAAATRWATCPKHGAVEVIASDHSRQGRCPSCGRNAS